MRDRVKDKRRRCSIKRRERFVINFEWFLVFVLFVEDICVEGCV